MEPCTTGAGLLLLRHGVAGATPVRGATTVIVEHDLAQALRSIPDSARGWDARKTSVRCQSCHAISVFDAGKIARRCDFCGAAALVPYEDVKDPFRPESLLPLKIPETRARELIRAWYRRQWLAPNDLDRMALTDTVRAVYLPYWTFDASVQAQWTAEAGDYYYVGSGKQRERRVRWRPASGELSHFFDDELVCASTGVDGRMLRQVEPFPTTDLVPYDAGYLAGWTVERYQIDLVSAAERSRQAMNEKLRGDVRRAGARRHAQGPAGARRFHRPDVQTRARAGVALDVPSTATPPTRCSSTGSPARSRARAHGAGSRSRCWCCSS